MSVIGQNCLHFSEQNENVHYGIDSAGSISASFNSDADKYFFMAPVKLVFLLVLSKRC